MTREEQWFIKRHNAATYGLMQMNMMGLDRNDNDFKNLDDWINSNEKKYDELTINKNFK